jgi:hypothetical protein
MLIRCLRIPAGFDKHNMHMKRVQDPEPDLFHFCFPRLPMARRPAVIQPGSMPRQAAPLLASRPFRPIGAIHRKPIKSMTYKNHTFFWIHGDAEIRIFYKNFGLPYLGDLAG